MDMSSVDSYVVPKRYSTEPNMNCFLKEKNITKEMMRTMICQSGLNDMLGKEKSESELQKHMMRGIKAQKVNQKKGKKEKCDPINQTF